MALRNAGEYHSLLTVVDALSTLSALLVEKADACDDHGELQQLSLFVTLCEVHEGAKLRLREDRLESRCERETGQKTSALIS